MGINKDQEDAFRGHLERYADQLDKLARKTGNARQSNEANRIRRIATHGSRRQVARETAKNDKIDVASIPVIPDSQRNPPRPAPARGDEGGMAHADGVQRRTGTGCFSVVIGVALAGGAAAAGLTLGISRANAAETHTQPIKPTTVEVKPDLLPRSSGIVFEAPKSSNVHTSPMPRRVSQILR